MKKFYIDDLLKPLQEWNKLNYKYLNNLDESYEEVEEQLNLCRLSVEKS